MKTLGSLLEKPGSTLARIIAVTAIASLPLIGAALISRPAPAQSADAGLSSGASKMRNLAQSLSFAFLLILGGCAGASTVASTSPLYSFGEFVLASGGRDTIVVVRGNPFGMDRKAFEKAVTDAMQGQNFGPRTNFTTGPSENAKKAFKVVILFNGSETVLADNLCKAPETYDSLKGAKDLHVLATYCWEDESLTEVSGWAGAVAGADSPVFAGLIGQTTLELFPSRKENDDDDRGDSGHGNQEN